MSGEEPSSSEKRSPATEFAGLRSRQVAQLLGMPEPTLRTLTEQDRVPPLDTEGEHRRHRRRDLDGLELEFDGSADGSLASPG